MTIPHEFEDNVSDSERGRPPTFLTLPERSSKPRRHGITHLLDKGMSAAEAEQQLAAAGPYLDIWKFGWGTAYLDPQLELKLGLLHEHHVLACTGGTLLELAWHQNAVEQFFDWAEAVGFPCIEISCGTVAMERAEKSRLIAAAAGRFTVLSEVGKKHETARVAPDEWAVDAYEDAASGSTWVVTEGRESGTVGLYDADGSVRSDMAAAVVSAVGLDMALFEAPRKDQQAWLVQRFGANVNLGNIAAGDGLAVETLRRGLRSDTADVGAQRVDAQEPAGPAGVRP